MAGDDYNEDGGSRFFDTFVPICQIIKRHISEDCDLKLHSSFSGLYVLC